MSRTLAVIFIFLLFCGQFILAQSDKKAPSFEEVISLRNISSVVISPDGQHIALAINTTDWKENRFDTEIWLSSPSKSPIQMTNNSKNSSFSPSFSPDGEWLAFLSDRGNKNQIHAMRVREGEGVSNFEWHPDSKRIFFVKNEKENELKKDISSRYGGFEFDDKEYTLSHVWQINFDPSLPDPSELPCYEKTDSLKLASGCLVKPKAKRVTSGSFTVTRFKISPDGNKIIINKQPDPTINSSGKSDIAIVDIQSGDLRAIVSHSGGDYFADWSPDSKEILYTTSINDTTSNYYKNAKIFVKNISSGEERQIATKLDEDTGNLVWNAKGIFGIFWKKTQRILYKLDAYDATFNAISNFPTIVNSIDFSKSGDKFVISARNGDQLNEAWIGDTQVFMPTQITKMTDQISKWRVAQSEVISWSSKDGSMIEGILHKPINYNPSKKYPLMVVIHGGPTGIDIPTPVPGYVYPILQWLEKGCLVLRPNYRGSAGYGEAFRSLNVSNLGVGDAWDVMSGIDYLDKKGMIDTSRMGSMGWSQGGYISAFLTTNTHRFKAISVGAGISNWVTYYVNTDIHPFTIQYLKDNPWDNEEIYKKTSPMTNIKNARTPTLIQHGENDKRVPIPNAYELLQGLRDQKVPADLVVYKGFGHGITKPKERLAATWHNWQWFGKYVWGEDIEIPTSKSK